MVSIVIPTYNRKSLVKRAMDSALEQDYTDFELLVVDDRSTDGTAALISEAATADSRIRYLRNEYQQGPAGARNFGIDHARGEYMAFLDSDDQWLPGHLMERILRTE